MNRILGFLFVAAGMLCPLTVAAAGNLTQDQIDKIIEEIDQLYRSNSSYGSMEMEIVTPHWSRTLTMDFWTQGMDKTFIRIKSPEKERGVATLRVGSEMWNYLPKTNKVIKIPPSMMMSSWMGSDFTNDDLVKEFSLFEDYTYEPADVPNPAESVIYINCIPREDLPIVWGNIVIAAREDDHIPLWQKYYDEKGNLMRVLEYSDIKTFGKRTIPSVLEMVPRNKEGHKTVIRYRDITFDAGIGDDVFTLRNLRSHE
jgi:outer membrane lipoprotein-sorting protein